MRVRDLRFVTAFCVIALCALALARGFEILVRVSETARDAAERDDAVKRGESLAGLLAERPASSLNWVLLAQARLQSGQPTERVLHALALSAVTGPNEGTVMAERARLGILLWESMPPDLKKRTIDDLVSFDLNDAINPGVALSLRPQPVREAIAAALQGAPGVTAARLQRLGIAR